MYTNNETKVCQKSQLINIYFGLSIHFIDSKHIIRIRPLGERAGPSPLRGHINEGCCPARQSGVASRSRNNS